MMPKNKIDTQQIISFLLKPQVSVESKVRGLMRLMKGDDDLAHYILKELVGMAAAQHADEQARELVEHLTATLEAMEQGAKRIGTFMAWESASGSPRHARVRMPDGLEVSLPAPKPEGLDDARIGDAVEIDQQGRAVLGKAGSALADTGEIATLEQVEGGHVNVMLRDQDKQHFVAGHLLGAQIEQGLVEPGARLVVCPRRQIAFYALEDREAGKQHYKYLARGPLPSVTVDDLGNPNPALFDLINDARVHLVDQYAWLRDRWPHKRLSTVLLEGPTGTGKTYFTHALERAIHELIASVAEVAIDNVPRRTFRLNTAEVLSPWLGVTDQNISRFFQEAERLASEPVELNGRSFHAPVLVILEEVDALARRRSTGEYNDEANFSRFLDLILSIVDPTRQGLAAKHILLVATTNLPGVLDAAFVRRMGIIIKFGRLNRRQFRAVFHKHLERCPVGLNGCRDEIEARQHIVDHAEAFVFAPNTDPGQLKLSIVGSSTAQTVYRRQMITPAIVSKAVDEATKSVRRQEIALNRPLGLSSAAVIAALNKQITDIVSACTKSNVHDYADIGDGQVSHVQAVPQPPMVSFHEITRSRSLETLTHPTTSRQTVRRKRRQSKEGGQHVATETKDN